MKTLNVNFPSLTAKQIMKSCDNKIGDDKLLYNTDWYQDDWYQDEDFFTKEKTRKGKRVIELELQHNGETWNECNELGEMLNFAEVLYLVKEYPEFRELLTGYKWTWTSSRSSDGRLVYSGSFGPLGLLVLNGRPGYSYSRLGVCFSRSGTPGKTKPETLSDERRPGANLENRVTKLEDIIDKLKEAIK